jgi:hypothetical protein
MVWAEHNTIHMEKENKLIGVHIHFIYMTPTGQEVTIQADINDTGWQQWGAPKEQLSENCSLIEAINEKVQEVINTVEEEE